jgi:hypothetical protein
MLTPPEAVECLTAECNYCHHVVDLPNRDQRMAAQRQRRQEERSHALVEGHLRTARTTQTRITLLIVAIVLLTVGLTFYKVLFGGLQ